MTGMIYTEVTAWPPLAWLARCRPGRAVQVFHGTRLETGREWFAEAAWAGPYAVADFDRTDLVFGSGGRWRDGAVTFVSSGTTVDRLQVLRVADDTWVSNSLPLLLAATDAVPDPTFGAYYELFKSITLGLGRYERELPTSRGPVRLVYFTNLRWDDRELSEVDKPSPARDFRTFDGYLGFLQSSLRLLGDNLSAPERRFPYRWLGTMSSGYDSLATAILARPVGLDEVVSLATGRGGGADSGAAAAEALGLRHSLISRDAWRTAHRPEVPFLAADAKGEDIFLWGAGPRLAGRALLTGNMGLAAWGRDVARPSDGLARSDQSGLSLTEFRLWTGFLHCPIVYWGLRQQPDLAALSRSPEMRPWDVGGRYNRPLARRIIETAGIRRGTFAVRKRAGSVLFFRNDSFLSPGSLEDFLAWLRDHADQWRRRGLIPPAPVPGRRTPAQRAAAITARIILSLAPASSDRWTLLEAVGRRVANLASREPLFRHVFPWATARAKERYAEGLRTLQLPAA